MPSSTGTLSWRGCCWRRVRMLRRKTRYRAWCRARGAKFIYMYTGQVSECYICDMCMPNPLFCVCVHIAYVCSCASISLCLRVRVCVHTHVYTCILMHSNSDMRAHTDTQMHSRLRWRMHDGGHMLRMRARITRIARPALRSRRGLALSREQNAIHKHTNTHARVRTPTLLAPHTRAGMHTLTHPAMCACPE